MFIHIRDEENHLSKRRHRETFKNADLSKLQPGKKRNF